MRKVVALAGIKELEKMQEIWERYSTVAAHCGATILRGVIGFGSSGVLLSRTWRSYWGCCIE